MPFLKKKTSNLPKIDIYEFVEALRNLKTHQDLEISDLIEQFDLETSLGMYGTTKVYFSDIFIYEFGSVDGCCDGITPDGIELGTDLYLVMQKIIDVYKELEEAKRKSNLDKARKVLEEAKKQVDI